MTVTEMMNKLIAAACEYKGMEIATVDTIVKEALPYWEHMAKAVLAK